MSVLEQILLGIGQELESELSSTLSSELPSARLRSFAAAAEPSEGSGTTPIYQLCPLPMSLNLADYRDALSNSNPLGDPTAAFRFRQLVDAMPVLAHEYMDSSSSIETAYGQIVQRASGPAKASYLAGMLADAKRKYIMEAQAELVGHGEWRLVEAFPYDWYTDKPGRYSTLEIPLDGSVPDTSGLRLLGETSQLMLTLGDRGRTALAGATNLKLCRLQYMFVRFVRPWMDSTLFKTAGWWLTGQPAGYCSSGRSDVNGGVLPLITTGMIITRAIEFVGDWDPADQARIANALDAGLDVYVGPFRLSKPAASVSSVDVVAWRSELIPFSPQSTAPPNPGSIRVSNEADFEAKYVVAWGLDGKQKVKGDLAKGASKTIDVPFDASDIVVRIQVDKENVYKQKFSKPTTTHLVIRGTALAPVVEEAP